MSTSIHTRVEVRGWGKTSVQTFSNLLKMLTEGTTTTENGSLFQYFATLNEKAEPFILISEVFLLSDDANCYKPQKPASDYRLPIVGKLKSINHATGTYRKCATHIGVVLMQPHLFRPIRYQNNYFRSITSYRGSTSSTSYDFNFSFCCDSIALSKCQPV